MNDLSRPVDNGDRAIIGMMLESNLFPYNQKLVGDLASLKYGVSITDACIDWEETESLILDAHSKFDAV